MWVAKLRMEIAFSDNQAKEGDKTSLKQEIFAPNQFSSVTGYHLGGRNDRGMVDVQDPKGEAINGNTPCGSALNAAIYPCDIGGDPDDVNSKTLSNWQTTYTMARQILYTPSLLFKLRFPTELKEYDQDGKLLYVYDSFLGYPHSTKPSRKLVPDDQPGNYYFSQTDHDEKWIWGVRAQ